MEIVKMANETLTIQEINALGNIFNTTFGRASVQGAGYGIKADFHGNRMVLKYQTVVHYNSSDGLHTQKAEHERESVEVLNQALAEGKRQFRDIAGRNLKIQELDSTDDVELISATANNPRKIAYYRRYITFEIS